jgi:hypothetical protein
VSEERWIVIPNWEKFQHPDAARSIVPPWIKDYTEQISKDEYLELSFHLRGVLHGLRLEYARSKRQLGGSTQVLSRRLGHTIKVRDLEALNHAGFITFSASNPARIPARIPARAEQRREEKKHTAFDKGSSKDGASTDRLGTDREYAMTRLLSEVKGSDEAKSRLRKWIERAEISPGLLAPASAIHLAREELLRRRGETKIKSEAAYVKAIIDRYIKGES